MVAGGQSLETQTIQWALCLAGCVVGFAQVPGQPADGSYVDGDRGAMLGQIPRHTAGTCRLRPGEAESDG